MGYKTILALLDHPDRAFRVAQVAGRIADRYDAVVHAIYVVPSLETLGSFVSGGAGPDVVSKRRAELRELGEESGARFKGAMANAACTWSFSIVESEHDFIGYEAIQRARVADLVISSQTPKEEDVLFVAEPPERLVLDAGRPVIVVPDDFSDNDWSPECILVAWDGSKEASRALSDSLPILERATSVKVVWLFGEDEANLVEELRGSFDVFLERHGVNAKLNPVVMPKADVADALGEMSQEGDFDLIVSGGYGESRLKELLLGGVTHWLLHKTRVPLFMSR